MDQKEKATIDSFMHLFPEWLMCEALKTSLSTIIPRIQLHFTDALESKNISDIFPALNTPDTNFFYEKPFSKNEFSVYGINKDIYAQKFWSLRPDFYAINTTQNLLLIFEAKGGNSIPSKVWDEPKEAKYFEFLKESQNFIQKGLFYLIPKNAETDCQCCIKNHFVNPSRIHIGYAIWEEMLEWLYNPLNARFIEWLVIQSKGISILNDWHKTKIS